MMTIAALAGVGVLAAQAEATAPKVHAPIVNAASGKSTAPAKAGSGSTSTNVDALPANSGTGTGTRIVYSTSARRIWLVEGSSTVEHTMQVVPGPDAPSAGTYEVSGKSEGGTSSDHVQVEYIVYFGPNGASNYGFDADAGITGLPPAPTGRSSAIRMAQTDAQYLYGFAAVGTPVIVL